MYGVHFLDIVADMSLCKTEVFRKNCGGGKCYCSAVRPLQLEIPGKLVVLILSGRGVNSSESANL